MSWQAVKACWGLEVPRSHLLVLIALAEHADKDGGSAFPSIERIAWMTGYTTRWVRKLVADLRNMGLLKVTRRAGQHRPTTYRLDLSSFPRRAGPKRRGELESRPDLNAGSLRGEAKTSAEPVSPPEPPVLEDSSRQSFGAEVEAALASWRSRSSPQLMSALRAKAMRLLREASANDGEVVEVLNRLLQRLHAVKPSWEVLLSELAAVRDRDAQTAHLARKTAYREDVERLAALVGDIGRTPDE